MNVLDEVLQSYSNQGNLELDQTRYTIKRRDHESADSKVIKLFQKSMHFVKPLQSWIVLLCLSTSK